ncbi:MAG: class I SAM-dependent DNA methyltransferase [Lachnospirales bacterium]
MNIYNNFAKVYDSFMVDTPYDDWISFLEKIWKNYNLNPKLILDLGCGTGTLTQKLAKKYDMIGIDLSEEMLTFARDKNDKEKTKVLYLQQDMCEFELYGTVDSIYCLCDGINYLTEKEDVIETFKLCNNYLNPKGLLIFDLNTEYKFKNVYGNNVFADNTEVGSYIWINEYDEDEKINVYDVNFFVLDENTSMYEKFDEYHEEKAYSLDEIKEMLALANLDFVKACDINFNDITETTERMYIIAQERGK